MKVCFTSSLFRMDETSGPSVFVKNISYYFQSRGIEVSFDPEKGCDLLFVVITTSPELVKSMKARGTKILQRDVR